jgi:acyl-CoA synthetase (AMP-forming)/AMP-acid ligase II
VRVPLILELARESIPERIAIEGLAGSLSYAQLGENARRIAACIAEMPIASVGYLGPNTPAFPITLFGSAIAGRPFSPLNYRLTDDKLRALVARLAPCVVIADATMMSRVEGMNGVTVLTLEDLLRSEVQPGSQRGTEYPETEVAVMLFTSGTTGEPKAAMLKHQNLTSYVMQSVEFLGAAEDEATLVSVPPYHIAAVSSMLTSIYSGRRIVQLDVFTPASWVAGVQRFGVTHAMLVPTMLGRVLDQIEAESLSLPSLRSLAYGGGRMPASTIRRALELLPEVEFTNAYGLTETSSTISLLGPEDHALARSGDAAALHRLGSVGKPIAGINIQIRDTNGALVAAGEPGEVWVRGDQVSGEYVGASHNDADGWFPTKDRGWFDEEGYLFIDGRLDDIIVRGGENISPGEIEDCLRLHEAVADIAVVGAPDDEWGERIVAFVVLHDGRQASADHLRTWVKDRLRSTRAPQDVFVRAELPYNETGKLLRRLLRAGLSAPEQR